MDRKLRDLVEKALSRRSFLAGAGASAAGTVLAGCGNSSFPNPTTIVTNPFVGKNFTDADYLNFALNLEYLEAEFYLRAATGNGLTTADTGNATSLTTGGAQIVGTTTLQMQYIYEIAQNELDHVRLLRSALGSAAVAAPAIDLTGGFAAVATGAGLPSTFNPFSNYNSYLVGAFTFEDVGVTAYHGAVSFLTVKSNVAAAAEIHAVEAYHAGSIRAQIVAVGGTTLTMANAVSTLRGALGGGQETTLTATSIVAANPANSVEWERTTDEVLHIVYGKAGAAGVSKGAFFPSGLNGNISTTLV